MSGRGVLSVSGVFSDSPELSIAQPAIVVKANEKKIARSRVWSMKPLTAPFVPKEPAMSHVFLAARGCKGCMRRHRTAFGGAKNEETLPRFAYPKFDSHV